MWNLPPIYICTVLDVGRNLIWCTGMQGIYAGYWGVHLPPIHICTVLHLGRKLIWCVQFTGGPSAFGIYMFSLCTGISLYFLISWQFWMGSHWWHWKVYSSLSALAVSTGRVRFTPPPVVNLKIWAPRHLGVLIKKVFSLHIRPIIKCYDSL